MIELYFLGILVLNIATAIIFYSLGKDGKIPSIQLPKRKREQQETNFTNPDLEDIRDVDPQKIQEAFLASLKKAKPGTKDDVAEKFEEFIN
jgi:hypothetical protein